jgi:hypothetical protein
MESIKSEKFSQVSGSEISDMSKIIGGLADHSHNHGQTWSFTSTWLGIDSDSSSTTDVTCDRGIE